MSELSFADVRQNVKRFGAPLIVALALAEALASCGGVEEDPNAIRVCPPGTTAGQRPIDNPGEFLQGLTADAKRYHVEIGVASENICGDEKGDNIYYTPAAAAAMGLIDEAKRRKHEASKNK